MAVRKPAPCSPSAIAIKVAIVFGCASVAMGEGSDEQLRVRDPEFVWRSDMGELALQEDWTIKAPYLPSTVVNDSQRGEVMKMESCGCCGHYYTVQGFECTMETPCLISYYVKGPNAWQGFSNQVSNLNCMTKQSASTQ